MAHCEQNPESWFLELDRGGRLFAYDATTLRSQNREAPPLDSALYERLEGGEPNPVKFSRFGGGDHGTTMLVRTAAGGSCSLVQATFAPQPMRRRRLYYFMLLGGVVVIALAAALGVFVVVQPLTRRIGKLRAASGVVGSPDGYVSAGDPAQDELGDLSTSLDRAHARIRADADSLHQRQLALERYLAESPDLKTPIASLEMALEQAAKHSPRGEMSDLLKSSLKDVIYLDALTTTCDSPASCATGGTRLKATLRSTWAMCSSGSLHARAIRQEPRHRTRMVTS